MTFENPDEPRPVEFLDGSLDQTGEQPDESADPAPEPPLIPGDGLGPDPDEDPMYTSEIRPYGDDE